MTRKQAIKEFKREGMIIPESAVKLAISDMEKLEKIERIVNTAKAFRLTLDSQDIQAICEILEQE